MLSCGAAAFVSDNWLDNGGFADLLWDRGFKSVVQRSETSEDHIIKIRAKGLCPGWANANRPGHEFAAAGQ